MDLSKTSVVVFGGNSEGSVAVAWAANFFAATAGGAPRTSIEPPSRNSTTAKDAPAKIAAARCFIMFSLRYPFNTQRLIVEPEPRWLQPQDLLPCEDVSRKPGLQRSMIVYEQIGEKGLAAIVAAFDRRVAANPVLRPV